MNYPVPVAYKDNNLEHYYCVNRNISVISSCRFLSCFACNLGLELSINAAGSAQGHFSTSWKDESVTHGKKFQLIH